MRGWRSKAAQVTALLRLAKERPALVCLTETFLDKATAEVQLEGYTVAARRDRKDDSGFGGVLVFVKDELANSVVLLEESSTE